MPLTAWSGVSGLAFLRCHQSFSYGYRTRSSGIAGASSGQASLTWSRIGQASAVLPRSCSRVASFWADGLRVPRLRLSGPARILEVVLLIRGIGKPLSSHPIVADAEWIFQEQ